MIIQGAAEQRTVLENVRWKTFAALLKETGEHRGSRFAYDRGTLEIMSPLYEHESYSIQLARLVLALAEELKIEIKSAGSTTLKRQTTGEIALLRSFRTWIKQQTR